MLPGTPHHSDEYLLVADSCRVMLLPALIEVSQAPPRSRAFLQVPRRWFFPHIPWTPSRLQKSLSIVRYTRTVLHHAPWQVFFLGGASYFSTALYGVDVPRKRELCDDDPFRATIERSVETGCFYYIQRGTAFNFSCLLSFFVGRPAIGANLKLFERVRHDEVSAWYDPLVPLRKALEHDSSHL